MKRFGDSLSVLLALALLGALGVGAYFALQFVIAPFTGLDKHVSTIIHVALVAVLFCIFIIAIVVRWTQKRASMDRMRLRQGDIGDVLNY